MKRLLLAFTPFALVTVAVVGVRAASGDYQETEHISRTMKIEPGGTVRVKSFSGRVAISATDGNEVVVNAVRRASRERLDHIKLDVHADGSSVYIDANHRDSTWWSWRNNVVETDFDITVPRRVDLDISVFSASVSVQGVTGSYRVSGFSSPITLEDVGGTVKAHTFSGSVEIQAKDWHDQDVDVDTFSGNITMRVPEAARGRVTFNSFSGHLNSDLPLTLRNGSRRSLKADLGVDAEGGGSLRFKTFSGSVRINR
jgi:DUF4097 and DUF4098 domain-containing protein YvlB